MAVTLSDRSSEAEAARAVRPATAVASAVVAVIFSTVKFFPPPVTLPSVLSAVWIA